MKTISPITLTLTLTLTLTHLRHLVQLQLLIYKFQATTSEVERLKRRNEMSRPGVDKIFRTNSYKSVHKRLLGLKYALKWLKICKPGSTW